MNIENTNFLHKTRKLGFTLVELIIVITILTILATIAFISFKNYNGNARDGNRMTTLKSIEKGLNLYFVKTSEFPIPDGNILTGSMNGTQIMYSGDIGENISSAIKLNKIALDPTLGETYKYGVTSNKQEYNLGGIGESDSLSQNIIPTTYANMYYGQLVGNYKGYIKYLAGSSHYITNVPSLIYTYSGSISDVFNDKNNVHFVIKKGENIPYQISGKVNNENPDAVIVKKTGKLNTKFINLDISGVVNASSDIEKKAKIQELVDSDEDILDSFGSDDEDMFETIINGGVPQISPNNPSSSSGGNSPSQNNCMANSSFDEDGKIFNVSQLNHSITADPKPYIDVTENNGTYRYELTVTCNDGVLYGIISSPIFQSCDASFHTEDNQTCISDIKSVSCGGSNPGLTSIHGSTTTNITWNGSAWPITPNWTHSTTTPGACQYQCIAGFYFNGTMCTASSAGYYVASVGATSQTACPVGQTSLVGATQCFPLTFTQLCSTSGQIYYTNNSGNKLASVTNTGVATWENGKSISDLTCAGHIVVCSNMNTGNVLKACNQGASTLYTNQNFSSATAARNTTVNTWAGGLYQWGRNEEVSFGTYVNSPYSGILTNGNVGNTNFYRGDSSYGDWWQNEAGSTTPTRWTGVNPQGPCPTDYHVPSQPEWQAVITAWGGGTNGTSLSKTLKLPLSGHRNRNVDSMEYQGNMGLYWSSSHTSSFGYDLYFASDNIIYNNYAQRAWGYSVRCFKN